MIIPEFEYMKLMGRDICTCGHEMHFHFRKNKSCSSCECREFMLEKDNPTNKDLASRREELNILYAKSRGKDFIK